MSSLDRKEEELTVSIVVVPLLLAAGVGYTFITVACVCFNSMRSII